MQGQGVESGAARCYSVTNAAVVTASDNLAAVSGAGRLHASPITTHRKHARVHSGEHHGVREHARPRGHHRKHDVQRLAVNPLVSTAGQT